MATMIKRTIMARAMQPITAQIGMLFSLSQNNVEDWPAGGGTAGDGIG
jgi:hypothetical protein